MRVLLIAACLPLAAALAALEVAADDFLAPAMAADAAERAERQRIEGEVVRGRDEDNDLGVVTGESAQDAINAAVDDRLPGCKRVEFPSGLGYVATGQASYRVHANPTASRLSKRQAYLEAYLAAQAALARALNGLDLAAKDEIRKRLVAAGDGDRQLSNLERRSEESLVMAARLLARGSVLFEVADDTEKRRVTVSVVTTPKTRARQRRQGAWHLEVADLEAAIAGVLAEVRRGVVPPVGGRIVGLEDGTRVAFVGFGSAVVRGNDDAELAGELETAAARQARMRADATLLGMLDGDHVSWRSQLEEETVRTIEEFERGVGGDPERIRRLDLVRKRYRNHLEHQERYRVIRTGELPPGVERRAWIEDGIAWAVSIFLPAARLPADEAAAGMRGEDEASAGTAPAEGDRDPADIEQGPTGTVTPEEDL